MFINNCRIQKPFYWFPYGFKNDIPVPIYHEIHPNALKEVSKDVKRYIYEAEVVEEQLSPLPGNPFAYVSPKAIPVSGVKFVSNAYDLFTEYMERGKLIVSFFEEKSEQQLNLWYTNLIENLKQKNMIEKANFSYAMFIKERLPHV